MLTEASALQNFAELANAKKRSFISDYAAVAELEYAYASEAYAARLVGSNPTRGTTIKLSGILPNRFSRAKRGKVWKHWLADVANNTIIKIEQGENINPTLDTLKKMAKALGVGVDDLIQ